MLHWCSHACLWSPPELCPSALSSCSAPKSEVNPVLQISFLSCLGAAVQGPWSGLSQAASAQPAWFYLLLVARDSHGQDSFCHASVSDPSILHEILPHPPASGPLAGSPSPCKHVACCLLLQLLGKWYIKRWAGDMPIPEWRWKDPLPPFTLERNSLGELEFRMNLT